MPETTLFGDPVSSPGQAVPQPSSKATMFGDPVSDPASTQRTAFGDPILAPSMGAMTPQQIEEFQKQGYESQVKGVMNRYGVPEFVARGLLSGGKPVDVAISVGLPLAGQIAGAIGGAGAGTAVAPGPGTIAGGISGASAGGALGGAAATGLVQMREMARGERPEFGVGQAIGDIALGAFVPKPLAAAAEGASLASRLGQIALQRGKEGALLGAGAETLKQVIDPATAGQEELVRSVMQKYGQDEATARMLVSGGEIATAGTLGSLVGAGLGTALEGLAPTIWKKIFNRTPEQAAVILEQESQTPEVVNARKVLDDILGPVESRAPKGEEVQRNIDVMMGIPSASQAPSEGAQMVSAVEKELGLAGPEAAAKPFMRKAVDAATVLDEAMAAQDRKIANLAGRLEEDLVQNRLGMEEISPMTEMDRIRALDRRARALAERPGESAKEQARIAAERERLTAKLPEESPMATPEDIPPTPEMSAQAQRMMDEYGRSIPEVLQSVTGSGIGFVYGWNTGEGLPPEERLARAVAYGAGGALTPIAIRKVISLQGWANSVLKERGPGSGALNTADPEVLGALAVKGAAILDEGANSFADWSKKMVSRFGDEIRPMLKEVWATGERSQIIPKGWAFGEESTLLNVGKAAQKTPSGEYPKLNIDWQYPETVPFTPKEMRAKGIFERELKTGELVNLLPYTGEQPTAELGEMLAATAERGRLEQQVPVVEVAWNGRKKVWQVLDGRGIRDVESFSTVNPTQELPVIFKAVNIDPANITAEMQAAPLVAQAKPTEMLQPTKQYWQEIVRPTFQKWFGKSQVVDDLGNPKMMVHGTFAREPFESTTGIFKPDHNGLIFASPSPRFAEWYAGMRAGRTYVPEDARLIKVFVRAENPFDFENPKHIKRLFGDAEVILGNDDVRVQRGRVERGDWSALEDLSFRIKALGFDGIFTKESSPDYRGAAIRNIAVFDPNQFKSSIANSGAYSLDNRDIGGFINRNLAIRAGSGSAFFALAFAEGKDLPPEERLTRALIAGTAAGAIAPKLLSPMLKGINNVTTPPPAAVTGGPVTPKTLADVEKIFTARPEGTPPSFSEKLQSAWVKGVSTLQNRFRVMDELEKNLMGASAPKLTLGDRFSLVAGAAGKADAGIYEVEKAQKNLIPEISRNDLNSFLFLRRTFDRLNTMANDPTSGSRQVGNWTMPDVQKVMTDLHAKLGTDKMQRMEQFAQVLQKSADDDLQLMVRSGRLSPKDYLDIKSKNDFYAPFYVMDYFTQHEGAVPGIGRSIDTTKPFTQAIKGLEDEDFRLGDIVSAFNANKLRANILADKNEAMQQLAKLTQADPNGLLIRDLGPSAAGINAPKGFSTVNYMENGVQKKLAVSPQVANAVKGMDTQQLGLLATIASGPASALRAGATGLNASFQVVNQFKDAARFGLVSKYGLRSLSDIYQLPLDLASGFVTSWKSNVFNNRDQLYQDYLKSGAARSTIASQLSPDSFSKLAQAPDQTAAAKYLGLPVKYFMDSTAKIGNAIEETVKIAGFKRGARIENLANLKGKDFEDALQQVAYEVRNYAGSPDFSKHGSVGKELNLLFMFANARMQGLAADLRRISGGTGKREGLESLLAVTGGIGFATYYLWAKNQQPENIDDFNSRPLTERNNYFLIPRYNKAGQPAYFTNEQGERVREFWRFPKSELIGQVANTMEGALNYAKTKDPEAAKKAAVNLMENMSPISITGRNFTERMESVVSGLNPLIKAPLEMASNRNLFAHRDIVPRNMVGASPEEQYRRTTPPGFISAAQAMPDFMPDRLRSPMQLQQLTSNLTAGLFTQFMRPEQEGRDPLVANPVLGRFFSAPYLDREEDWNAIDRFKTPSVDANLKRQRAIDDFLKKADSMPAQQKFDTMRQILAADPERNSQALLNAMKDKYVGTTDLDRYVRAMDAKSRAQYLEWKASTLPSQQERAMYYQTMASRGVLTKDVGEEIMKLRQAAPTTK